MPQISAESVLIIFYFARYVQSFTQKDNSRKASNRRTVSTIDTTVT